MTRLQPLIPPASYGAVPTIHNDDDGGNDIEDPNDTNKNSENPSNKGGTLHNYSRSLDNLNEPSFDPLLRTLSEGVTLLKNPSFAIKEAILEEPDLLHKLPAAGTATIFSEVANISKNLIGGGVLSLSGGMAMYANSSQACFSAILWVVVLGGVFGYFCLLIGKSCEMSLSASYRECWERTVGHRGGLLVAIANTLDPLLGIFANASILAQSLQLLLEGVDVYLSIVECLLLITCLALLPMCLMKNLDALAPFSALGMVAVLAALTCMLVRYLDGSYLPDGQFYNEIPHHYRPSFGNESRPWSLDALPFVCMVYTSFDMHYNSPRFYAELKDASIPRFGQVVLYSFGITAIIYFSIASVGFLTFGEHSDSYILNNYAARDSLATVSRLAIGLCALVSYPLNFIGVRDNCLDILGLADEFDTDAKLNFFTVLLLALLTLSSCFITDLGLINSVGGGTTVTLVCFIFPALMFREGVKKQLGQSVLSGATIIGSRWEVWLVMILMVVGVVLGIVGVWSSIALA